MITLVSIQTVKDLDKNNTIATMVGLSHLKLFFHQPSLIQKSIKTSNLKKTQKVPSMQSNKTLIRNMSNLMFLSFLIKTAYCRFSNNLDIKIFKKEDEPNSKGMNEADFSDYMKKIQNEKGASLYKLRANDYNWDNAKHRDALLEQHSMKQQKQKEKILNEKLQGMKEQIEYYPPYYLRLPVTKIKMEPPGFCSIQKEAHSNRLNDVLSCFYANRKQIPEEPVFQIQNKSTKATSQPKNISFDKLMFNDLKDLSINQKGSQAGDKSTKPLKGILKRSPQELKKQQTEKIQPSHIDPNLITLLRQINSNKSLYTKQKSELLLKPYKQSGELDILRKNPEILSNILKAPINTPVPNSQNMLNPLRNNPSPSPQPSGDNRSGSAGRYQYKPPLQPPNNIGYNTDGNNNTGYQNYGNYKYGYQNNQYPQGYNQTYSQPINSMNSMGSMNSMTPNTSFGNKNYKTQPCKYFHSVQGCVKGSNCTYIHEQNYAGRPTPTMQMGGVSYNNQRGDSQTRMSQQRNLTSAQRQMTYPNNYQNNPPPNMVPEGNYHKAMNFNHPPTPYGYPMLPGGIIPPPNTNSNNVPNLGHYNSMNGYNPQDRQNYEEKQ